LVRLDLLCFKLGGKRLDELLSHGFTLMQTAIVRRNYNTDNAFVQACSPSVHQVRSRATSFLEFSVFMLQKFLNCQTLIQAWLPLATQPSANGGSIDANDLSNP
jgi:hypothetical protein